MNVAEKVATLESLLKKVQRNAAQPRERQDVAGAPIHTTATAARPPEPLFDDVISAIEAHSPEGFPGASKGPKLTALAEPLHSGAAAQAKPAAAQPAQPAQPPAAARQAQAPATPPGVAKPQPAPAAKTPAAPAVAKAPPAAAPVAAKAPTPAAASPTPPAAAAKAPAKPETGGKFFDVADDFDADLDMPGVVGKRVTKSPGIIEAPRKASDFDSELSFADVLPMDPEEEKAARAPAKPPEPPPRKPAEPARATPLPDAARASSADAKEAARKEPLPGRRSVDETTVERNVLADSVVDDEPTVVRTGLEDELAAATRKPEMEDEETAVVSARSQARAQSIHDEKTVEADSVHEAAVVLREDIAPEKKPEAKKPEEKKPAEAAATPAKAPDKPAAKPTDEKPVTKPADAKPADKQPDRSREEEPTEIGRRPPKTPTQEGKRSPSLVLLAGAACILAAAAAYWGFTRFGGGEAPTPPAPQPTQPVGKAPDPTPTAPQTAAPTGTTAPAGTAAPTETAAPTTTAAPVETAAPTTTAAPVETAAPSAPPKDPATLPSTKGYLVVSSPEVASVYVNGVFSGKTGEPLEVLCGTRNVRLGKLTDDAKKVPEWISPGQPAIIACKASTTISLAPGASPPAGAPAPGPAPAPRPGGDTYE